MPNGDFRLGPDPGARSDIIYVVGLMGGNAQAIIDRYDQETDVSVQRVLLLCLGQFDLSDADRLPFLFWGFPTEMQLS